VACSCLHLRSQEESVLGIGQVTLCKKSATSETTPTLHLRTRTPRAARTSKAYKAVAAGTARGRGLVPRWTLRLSGLLCVGHESLKYSISARQPLTRGPTLTHDTRARATHALSHCTNAPRNMRVFLCATERPARGHATYSSCTHAHGQAGSRTPHTALHTLAMLSSSLPCARSAPWGTTPHPHAPCTCVSGGDTSCTRAHTHSGPSFVAPAASPSAALCASAGTASASVVVQLVSELVGPDDVRVMRRIVMLSIEPTDASFPTQRASRLAALAHRAHHEPVEVAQVAESSLDDPEERLTIVLFRAPANSVANAEGGRVGVLGEGEWKLTDA
jgi:hypothetical protein